MAERIEPDTNFINQQYRSEEAPPNAAVVESIRKELLDNEKDAEKACD